EGKSILLVDDVYTTGRTILYAKKLIEDSGASLVQSVSLAR
ncbi:MAG: phosphoribosyltransferase family protein, partial [Carnobacterium sp.]